MAKSVLISRIVIGVLFVLSIAGLTVWLTRLPSPAAYLPQPSLLSGVSISDPANGSVAFLKDSVSVNGAALTSHTDVHFELWVDGTRTTDAYYYVDAAGVVRFSDAPQSSAGSPPIGAGGSGRTRMPFSFQWIPESSGDHTLVMRAISKGGMDISNAVRVTVVDPAAMTPGPVHPAQAGETLNTIANQLSLPTLALGIANPKIASLDEPLPAGQPVNIPNLPPEPQPGGTPPGAPSDLPVGAVLAPATAAPGNVAAWFDFKVAARLNPASRLPAAPLLFRSRDGCNVHLYIRDNSDNELGFFIYRLDPGASDFVRLATLGAHKGVAFIEYVDKDLYGDYQYYASAFNTLGEAAGDPTSIAFDDSACAKPVSGVFKLKDLHLSLDAAADKAYCYYSLQEGSWSRLPADPNAFVYPANGRDFDLGSQLPGPPVLPAGARLQFDCWGWSADTLSSLGSGSASIPSQAAGVPLEVKGGHFTVTGNLDLSVAAPVYHTMGGGGSPPVITAPRNLTSTRYLDVCVNHFPPPMEFLGGLFCKAAVDTGSIILVWDWSPDPLTVSDIDGYHIYKSYPGGKPALIKTINDRTQTVLIQDAESAGKPAPCYFARAYWGSYESPNSNTYCWKAGAPTWDTVFVFPTHVYTQDVLSYDKGGTFSFCTEGLGGDAMFALKDGQVASGYEYSYDESRCSTWIDHYYRGRVVFDVSGIKGAVTSATLYYKQGDTDARDYLFPQSCAHTLDLVTATSGDDATSWRSISSLAYYGMPGKDFSADVTEAVQAWVLGEDANLGLLFRGRNESLPEKTNDICWSNYGNFSLAITYYTLSK